MVYKAKEPQYIVVLHSGGEAERRRIAPNGAKIAFLRTLDAVLMHFSRVLPSKNHKKRFLVPKMYLPT